MTDHTKECTYRNNHDFRHDNCFCACHPKNEKRKGNLKPEMRKNMEKTVVMPKVVIISVCTFLSMCHI